MLIRPRTRTSPLTTRLCVACGYAGPELQRSGPRRCPRCACDFQLRPPRSYAEMENLDQLACDEIDSYASGSPLRAQAATEPYRHWCAIVEHRELRALRRWLTGVFISVLCMIGLLFVMVLAITAET